MGGMVRKQGTVYNQKVKHRVFAKPTQVVPEGAS
jgi:hypothetical protein